MVELAGPGDEEDNAYTAALLGKFPILIGWAQRQAMPTACTCYVGYVLELLLLVGWWEEREHNKLQNGHFL